MKTPLRHIHSASALILGGLFLVLLTPDANAQFRRANIRRGAGASAIGDPAELAVHRDKFMAFRRTQLVGAGYYTKPDFRLQGDHAAAYSFIESSTVGGRLSEGTARDLVGRLMAIGNKAATLRVGAESLSAEDSKTIAGEIRMLRAEARTKISQQALEATLMPDMNRCQWLMEELLVFGKAEGALSGGKAGTLRRKLEGLEKAEDDGQSDGSLDDREREKLLRESRETWRAFVEALS